MFWLFGGALEFGTGGQPAYDGSHFAAYEDIVLVTINYRTNGEYDSILQRLSYSRDDKFLASHHPQRSQ